MTTYTVIAPGGTVIGRNLTALRAMREMLTYDGYAYRFRRDRAGNLFLYHTDGSANSTRGARNFVRCIGEINSSLPGIAGQREIAELVINADWPRLPEAMTDADYDALQAQISADTINLTDWLAQSDSRETSPEILAAIFAVAENHTEDTLDVIWGDPERYDLLVTIYEIVTQNGLNDPTDFFWGANGSSWADSRKPSQAAQ